MCNLWHNFQISLIFSVNIIKNEFIGLSFYFLYSEIVICPAGQYGRVNQNIGQCLQCPLGTYQPNEGQFKCLVCPTGRVIAGKGAEDISKCIPGKMF